MRSTTKFAALAFLSIGAVQASADTLLNLTPGRPDVYSNGIWTGFNHDNSTLTLSGLTSKLTFPNGTDETWNSAAHGDVPDDLNFTIVAELDTSGATVKVVDATLELYGYPSGAGGARTLLFQSNSVPLFGYGDKKFEFLFGSSTGLLAASGRSVGVIVSDNTFDSVFDFSQSWGAAVNDFYDPNSTYDVGSQGVADTFIAVPEPLTVVGGLVLSGLAIVRRKFSK